MADAAAQSSGGSDYQALVCVFLYGGNDHANTLVPVDTTRYAQYAQVRGALATAASALTATTLVPGAALPDGQQLALAPQLAPLKTLWDAGALAVQLNVGPLIVPTTVAQYQAKSVPLPPKLMSHNDQQSIWQSDLAEGATSGWGGRIGDLMLSGNGGSLFTCTSVTGNAVFLSGHTVAQYQLSSSGAVAIRGLQRALFGSTGAQAALRTLITGSQANLFADEYARVTRRSIDAEALVTSALAGLPDPVTVFPGTNLGGQLRMVARMIAARASFGVRRQVFFVSLGGFDLHDNLLENHPGLLTQVADAMKAFYDATVEMGVADKVATFSASDFGRTLSSNGDGSDHGWGAHHLVMGGAVKGRAFYGTPPAVEVNGPDDVGQGRLLPTTSVDQFGATLARWFGVSDTDLATVVPNIGNFSQKTTGFL
jgi:uncharacterized protein (DUF1501 family)